MNEAWLCKRRIDWSASNDVWRFRQSWSQEKERLREELLTGTYEVGLLSRVTLDRNGKQEDIDLWSARDVLVMKALSLALPQYLPLSKQCTHIKGHGGGKFAVRQVLKHLSEHRFVLKTDVQSYYASMQVAHRTRARGMQIRVLMPIKDIERSRYATGTDSQTLSCVAERNGNQGNKPAYTQFQSAICIG